MAAARLVLTAILLVPVACEDAPKFHAPMTLGGVEVSAEVLNTGARVYEMRCATCHGADGSGQGSGGQALAQPPRDFRAADFRYKSTEGDTLPTDADLALTIREGRVENGMPSWRTLTAEDQHAVIQYIKTFSTKWQGGAQAPVGGAG
jgi:mono/diheme cytochrome c family protein